ncbi:MAG: hypothetical protein ACU0CO_06565 [Shimia sp.]
MPRLPFATFGAVTFLAATVGFSLPSAADTRLDPLFERLQRVDPADAETIEKKIWSEWGRSGSPAIDLLLDRGTEAMEAKDYALAIDHFTALTDHAPDFAHGFHARASAFFARKAYGPALDDLERALRLDPRHFGAMGGLATIYEELGYAAEALEVNRRIQALHPHRKGLAATIAKLERRVGTADL